MHAADAASVRSLAALVRAGLTTRQALSAWPEELPQQEREGPLLVRQRLLLGAGIRHALEVLPRSLGHLLVPVATLHISAGGDVAAALDRVSS